ncbi:MAG: methyl-accepting chemotaxis protein [SAR324 cluster bacterium]|nr:methyl-accepting chemotaxis protein [SAR324 cluster bacterium]
MKFSELKIGTRLYSIFIIVIIIFSCILGYQINLIQHLGEIEHINAKRGSNLAEIINITVRLENVYPVIADAIINRNLDETRRDWEQIKTDALKDIERTSKLVDTDEERSLARDFGAQYNKYLAIFNNKMLPLLNQGNVDMAQLRIIDGDIDIIRSETLMILRKIIESLEQDSISSDKEFNEIISNSIVTAILLSVLGIIIAVILIYMTIQNINNLLRKLILNLSSMANNLASASEEIASSSQMLSSGASQQAASLEETSSSMEEISIQTKENVANASSTTELMRQVVDMVKATADNSHSAAELSQSAKNAAENGVQSMGAIAGAMREIREGSEKITDIIEVINEITHQTKMLATNAAIEAARAGDQGKGFAVVADEVSKLAENSKKAAKEIAGLIRESVRKAEAGNELAQKGEGALQEILKQSRQVSDLIETISSAATEQSGQMVVGMRSVENIRVSSEEQANGVEQINRALVDLDKVTQSNAANAEETASASEELSSQAMGLRDLVEELSRHVGTMDQASAPPVRTHTQNKIFKGTSPVASLPATTGNKGPNTSKIGAQQSIAMRDDFKEF